MLNLVAGSGREEKAEEVRRVNCFLAHRDITNPSEVSIKSR